LFSISEYNREAIFTLDHDTETENGRKKHSLHSKHFRVKIGASAKKVHPLQFLRGRKSKKCFQPAENPAETLVTKAKKPKKHDVERLERFSYDLEKRVR